MLIKDLWCKEARKLLFIVVVAALVGYGFGFTLEVLCLTLVIYWAWQILQLRQIERWLAQQDPGEPPHCKGFLIHLIDRVYELQKREKRAQLALKGIIHRAQASANALEEGIAILDHYNCLEWWNKSASRMIGLQYPQDTGQPITHLLRDPSFVHYFNEQKYESPLVLKSPESLKRTFEFRITLFGKNNKLILIRDITDLVHLERVRSDFIANISHELRTPLTVLKGYIETFLDIDCQFSDRHLLGFQSMQEQTERMQSLLEDLLLLSKLEKSPGPAAKLSKESLVLLPKLLDSLIEEARVLGKKRDVSIEFDFEGTFDLYGCPQEIRSAFSNIIINAVHYSKPNSSVFIRCFLLGRQGCFQVVDRGIGIESKHITRLTERFYRVDQSRYTSTGGTGLGLAIVKHVLLRHQAELKIESHIDQGSIFTCVFSEKRTRIHPVVSLEGNKLKDTALGL